MAKRRTVTDLFKLKGQTPVVCATAYDAWMASMLDGAVDLVLVGDSLGNVVQGRANTVGVTLEEMLYHTKLVSRGLKESFLVMDLPFMSYQQSIEQAMLSSSRALKESGAQAVKMEGGLEILPQINACVGAGIPVMGHVGMQPQRVHQYGSYAKRGKEANEAKRILDEAKALEKAGVFAIVLENIPAELAKKVTTALKSAITIGIGAGAETDGQIQVFHDLFGLYPDFSPRHAVAFRKLGIEVQAGAKEYAAKVRARDFDSK